MDKKTMKKVVYRANQRYELGFWETLRVMFYNVIGAKELIWELFKRDFLGIYKKSFLGASWLFISPVLGIVSWVFLQMTGILNPGKVGVPYPVYVLIGSSMWSLFIGFYDAGALTLTAGKNLVMQVSYPHESLLFKETGQFLAGFLISFLMNIIVIYAFGIAPSWKIVFLPIVILPIFFLGGAIGLIISMFSVVAIDVKKFVDVGMGLLMWVTPVIYSDKIDSNFIQLLIKWNPLTYLICSARDLVLYGRLYNAPLFFFYSILSFLFFLVSWELFYVSEDKIIERMI